MPNSHSTKYLLKIQFTTTNTSLTLYRGEREREYRSDYITDVGCVVEFGGAELEGLEERR